MLTISRHRDNTPVVNRQALHALGVLIPIQFHPVKILPGRHPLGRAGDGMRLLRTRPYVIGEDNPRDIDKFSPAADRQVNEWEDEALASIMLFAAAAIVFVGSPTRTCPTGAMRFNTSPSALAMRSSAAPPTVRAKIIIAKKNTVMRPRISPNSRQNNASDLPSAALI